MSILFLPGRYGRRLQYRSHTIVYRRVGSWMRVRWRLTKARHVPFLWSGRVVWAVKIGDFRLARHRRRSVQVRVCTSVCKSEKKFGIIIIIIIIIIVIIIIIIIIIIIVIIIIIIILLVWVASRFAVGSGFAYSYLKAAFSVSYF